MAGLRLLRARILRCRVRLAALVFLTACSSPVVVYSPHDAGQGKPVIVLDASSDEAHSDDDTTADATDYPLRGCPPWCPVGNPPPNRNQ